MRWFISDRQQGKTTRALQEAFKVAKDHATVFLCFSNEVAKILRREHAQRLAGSKLEIFGLQEFQLVERMRSYAHIYIDDADQILLALVHQSLDPKGAVRLVTATGLPVRDLDLIRKGAAMIWEEAATLVLKEFRYDDDIPVEVRHVAAMMKEKAAALSTGGKDEVRDRGSPGEET